MCAIFVTVMFIRHLPDVSNYYMLLVDAIGMAIFNVVGIEKALIEGTTMMVALTMGMTTGIFGGLIRDVICREVPLVMREELYSTACFAGGLTYATLFLLEAPLFMVHHRFVIGNRFSKIGRDSILAGSPTYLENEPQK